MSLQLWHEILQSLRISILQSLTLDFWLYLDRWIAYVSVKECANMLITVFRYAYAVVLLQWANYCFVIPSKVGHPGSDLTDAGFAALNLSKLFDEEPFVCALEPGLWLSVFKFTLRSSESVLITSRSLQLLTGSCEYESVVPNLHTVFP